jgi:hypothetical protein
MQRLFVDPPQEFQEFLGTMARQTFTDDLASRNVEGGEQPRALGGRQARIAREACRDFGKGSGSSCHSPGPSCRLPEAN